MIEGFAMQPMHVTYQDGKMWEIQTQETGKNASYR